MAERSRASFTSDEWCRLWLVEEAEVSAVAEMVLPRSGEGEVSRRVSFEELAGACLLSAFEEGTLAWRRPGAT